MSHMRTLAATAVLLGMTGLAYSADPPSIGQLLKEFQSQAPAIERTAEQWDADYARVVRAMVGPIGDDNVNTRKDPQQQLQTMALRAGRPGAEVERAAISKAMALALGNDKATVEAKAWLLRQLERVGQAEVVEAVASRLDDADPRVRECARRTLQNNPSTQADAALVVALAATDQPDWQVALINALGSRANPTNAAELSKWAGSDDDAIRSAAMMALARCGDKSVAPAIEAARVKGGEPSRRVATEAYLLLADRLCVTDQPAAVAMYRKLAGAGGQVKCAAIIGLGRANSFDDLPTILTALADEDIKLRGSAIDALALMTDSRVTAALSAKAGAAEPDAKVWLLRALLARKDKSTLPTFLAAANDANESVCAAGLAALGDLGDANTVPVLLTAATTRNGRPRSAAQTSLDRLSGQGVDAAVLKALGDDKPVIRAEAARSLGQRHYAAAIEPLLKAAADSENSVAAAAMKSVGILGGRDALDRAVALLVSAGSNRRREAAKSAIVEICLRQSDTEDRAKPVLAAMDETSGATRLALLGVLGKIGGKQSLKVVLAEKESSDEKLRDAAVRSLAGWPDPDAIGLLLALAKATDNQTHHVLALRGYHRLVGQASLPPAKALEMFEEGIQVARRTDEKALMLSGVGDIRDLAALKMAESYMGNSDLKKEAASAVVRIGRRIWRNNLQDVKAAMVKAKGASTNDRTTREADEAIGWIDKELAKNK